MRKAILKRLDLFSIHSCYFFFVFLVYSRLQANRALIDGATDDSKLLLAVAIAAIQ